MRILGIVLFTLIAGSVLYAIAVVIALFVLKSADASGAIGIVSLIALPLSYYFAARAGAKFFRDKSAPVNAQPETTKPKSRFRAAGIAVGVVALVVGTIAYLESSAEAGARAFCDAAPPGTPRDVVVEAARGKGTNRLRLVQGNSITVGFTGLPPYSRHFCTVETKEGKVVSARYSTLD